MNMSGLKRFRVHSPELPGWKKLLSLWTAAPWLIIPIRLL